MDGLNLHLLETSPLAPLNASISKRQTKFWLCEPPKICDNAPKTEKTQTMPLFLLAGCQTEYYFILKINELTRPINFVFLFFLEVRRVSLGEFKSDSAASKSPVNF